MQVRHLRPWPHRLLTVGWSSVALEMKVVYGLGYRPLHPENHVTLTGCLISAGRAGSPAPEGTGSDAGSPASPLPQLAHGTHLDPPFDKKFPQHLEVMDKSDCLLDT